MQRLAVALLLIAVVAGGLYLAVRTFSRLSDGEASARPNDGALPRLSFGLLSALMLYAAFAESG